jgi:hypothetical protein
MFLFLPCTVPDSPYTHPPPFCTVSSGWYGPVGASMLACLAALLPSAVGVYGAPGHVKILKPVCVPVIIVAAVLFCVTLSVPFIGLAREK